MKLRMVKVSRCRVHICPICADAVRGKRIKRDLKQVFCSSCKNNHLNQTGLIPDFTKCETCINNHYAIKDGVANIMENVDEDSWAFDWCKTVLNLENNYETMDLCIEEIPVMIEQGIIVKNGKRYKIESVVIENGENYCSKCDLVKSCNGECVLDRTRNVLKEI